MTKEPFNLEQFKAGRKAITRSGHIASFVFHREDFYDYHQLGASLDGIKNIVTYGSRGTHPSSDLLELTHMAPAEHGIDGMPWDLPAPPAPPEGHKWVHRGKGWGCAKTGLYAVYSPTGLWALVCTTGGFAHSHYLEAVPVEISFPPAPEGREWWNFHNATPKQVGVSEGWRLLLKGERIEEGDEFFLNCYRAWESTSRADASAGDNRDTYRTRRPLPVEPESQSCEKSQPPCEKIRLSRFSIRCETPAIGVHTAVTHVEPDRVVVEDDGSISVVTTQLWPWLRSGSSLGALTARSSGSNIPRRLGV
jgi:hypothetical protein